MAKKMPETVIVPVRVRNRGATYALALKIQSRNGVAIKVLHNLLDGKSAYFGQDALERVLRHLGPGALVNERILPAFPGEVAEQPFQHGKYAVYGVASWKVGSEGEILASGDVNYPLFRTDNHAFAVRVLRKLRATTRSDPHDFYIYPNASCLLCGREAGKNRACQLCQGATYIQPVLSDEQVGKFQERETVHVESYFLDYKRCDVEGGGYGFDCDKEGNILTDKISPLGLENLEKCRSGAYDVICEGVVDYSYHYIQPALARCYCGCTVILSEHTNECEVCGRKYNMSGQLLHLRNQCAEDCD